MPLSWNEIKSRAMKFSRDWADEASEDAEAKSFWDAFFNVFGITRKRVASFEKRIKTLDGKDGYIDLLWKGILLVEHKSRGKSLTRAYKQAIDYFPGIKERDLPRYILVSDFARFHLYDLETEEQYEFSLPDLYKHVRLFGFIAGYQTTAYKDQDAVNIRAAERMGTLHDQLKAIGYAGHELEVYLVRLLFCLFAEDTSIFERRQFQDLIEQRTAEDGQDLAQWLAHLFEVLDRPLAQRLQALDEQLAAFPYVNGSLFSERLSIAAFDRDMRDTLLECCSLDWSQISPAIFGSLFQSVMDRDLRRNLGAHYTTEKNILKVIGPLFLDDLRAEFERVKTSRPKLADLHERIARLRFLDPACGCGNFLVIAYRELRKLELDILRALLKGDSGQRHVDVGLMIQCNVDQFYGIEVEEFPAQIAQTALWLMDHQMNMVVSVEFGDYFTRLPLTTAPTIIHGNALQLDWREVIAPDRLSHILGNPPFGGKKEQKDSQKRDMAEVFRGTRSAGVLDYVSAWFRKAAEYMADNTAIVTGFVSTNSITQGEQVGVLWPDLLVRGVTIHFAHRTFQWSSEARGKAAVHCVIIGFALRDTDRKRLFDYEDIRGEPHEVRAGNINPYLVDAGNCLLMKRSRPISPSPIINKGSEATDFGHLILSPDERVALLRHEPQAEPWIKRFIGGDEFINGTERYCLWLVGINPSLLMAMPLVSARVAMVRDKRLASDKARTREWAAMPTLFTENRQPNSDYVAIPKVSSERRSYIPIGYVSKDWIASGSIQVIPNATLFDFGVLTATMHMAWMRAVAGRLESRYQYSNSIVYNNFPWPNPTDAQRTAIETAAQAVLDARALYPDSTLADLYDPLSMPPELVNAHRKLDQAVDAAYARKKFTGDSDRVAFLFERYQALVGVS